jgi:hypothetical protein
VAFGLVGRSLVLIRATGTGGCVPLLLFTNREKQRKTVEIRMKGRKPGESVL